MVKATIKTASDTSIRIMPQSTPGVPGMMACGGYSVQPAPVDPPGTKKLAIKNDDGQQIHPDAQHVQVGKHHVAGAYH